MAGIKVQTFGGIIPQLSPRLLPESAATIAENARFDSGRLASWRTPTVINDHDGTEFTVPTTTKTIYRYRDRQDNDYWLIWDDVVHAAPSPIAEDPHDRLYWTGDLYPRMALGTEITGSVAPTYEPTVSRKLGVTAPEDAPSATVTVTSDDTTVTPLSRAYAYTWVSGLGEESAPSPASDILDVKSGETVALTFTGSLPAYVYSTASRPALRRIYRTNINGEYQFVQDILATVSSVDDTVLDENLGELLTTQSWSPAPDDDAGDHPDGPMRGLTTMPNGVLAGFTGRSVFFSEPFLPHTFPRAYSLVTKSPIVGLASVSIGLMVMTEGKPVLMTGSSPSSMSAVEIDNNQACVSSRSIADMGSVALYASPDGLVAAGENGVSLVTEGIFSRDQWQELNPPSIHAYHYEGRYIFFWQNGASSGGYVFDGRMEVPLISTLDYYALAGFNDPKDDALYLVIAEGAAAKVKKFDSGSAQAYTWQSKEMRSERPINPSCALIDAESYPISFTLYADGTQKHTQSVANGNMFRLPAGYLAKDFQVKLSGTGDVNQVMVAESPEEFL
jgi:hypothetical protein